MSPEMLSLQYSNFVMHMTLPCWNQQHMPLQELLTFATAAMDRRRWEPTLEDTRMPVPPIGRLLSALKASSSVRSSPI